METPHRARLEARLRDLLATHPTLKLATSSPDADPWIATAYFAAPDPFSLVVMIEGTGRTLRNLRANARVALMIEATNPMAPFAQADGRASVVAGAAVAFRDAIAAKTPESRPLVGLPGLVPVRIDVTRWRITDVPNGWLPAHELAAEDETRRDEPGREPLSPRAHA
jgi:hypothetical protein